MRSRILHHDFHKPDRGFTIIETLVAITVLMIAIAGPLVVASQGLFAALASRDQMTASYLAQESLETIKNIRDNSLALNGQSYDGNGSYYYLSSTPNDTGASIEGCNTGTPCDASATDDPAIVSCGNGPCPIYMNSNIYSHEHLYGNATPFTRYFTISPGTDINESVITVYVDWNEGSVPYQVALSSELTNSKR